MSSAVCSNPARLSRRRAAAADARAARGGGTRGLALALLLLAAPTWAAEPEAGAAGSGDTQVRAVGGTSIIGNRELPKSLYIVPWKNSEVGLRTDLSRDLLDEGLTPVDPNEFQRQVDYYEYHQQQQ